MISIVLKSFGAKILTKYFNIGTIDKKAKGDENMEWIIGLTAAAGVVVLLVAVLLVLAVIRIDKNTKEALSKIDQALEKMEEQDEQIPEEAEEDTEAPEEQDANN